MAIFKCKMCGGDLEVTEGLSVAECQYCGTKQTVSKSNDEVVSNLFNRANNLRLKCEFDKAEQVYEKILDINNDDSEAHWGLVLCKYGIEYVEDPKTYKRVPTCHRTLYEAVLSDVDYLAAVENADTFQKELYLQEATLIDTLQKDILNIVNNEKPFDVFICYKETDENGKRTIDSSIANDIYYQLTSEGFKVFYAAITLEDKLGQEYEPYIFAALNSAKVMLVVGTKPQYFDAVWVRNEWSRFLKLMKTDRSKLLIPCYRDMDAYELPDQFAHLQSQDMSKIGFINDIVRGIKKVVTKSQEPVRQENVVMGGNANADPLIKRAFMFLEDGDFNSAAEYCEKVLDIDPENALAYLGKLMVDLGVRKQENLRNCTEPFDSNNNFAKVIRFANVELATEIKGYIEYIKNRNKQQSEERDKQEKYNKAMEYSASNDIARLENAISIFNSLVGYKDCAEKSAACNAKLEELKVLEEKQRLEREQREEKERIANEKRRKRNKKIAAITIPIVCVVSTVVILLNTVIIPNSKYDKAVALMKEEKYTEAIVIFETINSYKDSANLIEECNATILVNKYNNAVALMKEEKYQEAIIKFTELDNYKDSKTQIKKCEVALYGETYTNTNVGEYIKFGKYEQDDNRSNGKESVEWLVLDKKDGKVFLLSKYALACAPYNTTYTDVTWETCSLRKWLNETFLKEAFFPDEQAKIATTTVTADKNPAFNTNQGNATQDKVFLLSISEVNKYFTSDSSRLCKPTESARLPQYTGDNNEIYIHYADEDYYWWLLRSLGDSQKSAADIYFDGSIRNEGYSVLSNEHAVRPAMWVDLNQ